MTQYAHPEVLVDTSWVKGSLGDQNVRVVEVDYDPTANYNLGHIPGSVLVDWRKDINDPVARDIVSKKGLESLLGRLGISNKHRIVLYGDFNNWFAAFAFWVFKFYGVENVVLLDGWNNPGHADRCRGDSRAGLQFSASSRVFRSCWPAMRSGF